MPDRYSLTVTNNSDQFQDIVVYQKPVDLGVPGALSLAWLTAPAHPTTTVTFTWHEEYNFVWSRTNGPFVARQVLPADPDNPEKNQVQLGCPQGAFSARERPPSQWRSRPSRRTCPHRAAAPRDCGQAG
jgi:hypothetical protein